MGRTRSPATLHHVAVNKLTASSRKIGPRRIRVPWKKKRSVRRRLTNAERKAQLAKRQKRKADLNERLKDIREYILKEALSLKEDFGGRDHKYYYRLIMQQSGLAFRDPQEITLWNAFVHAEFEKLNAGEC